MDATFQTAHRAKLLLIVENIRETIIKLSLKPRASFTIDTGQTKETVTYQSLPMLKNIMREFIDEINSIDEDLSGGGDPVYTRPAW